MRRFYWLASAAVLGFSGAAGGMLASGLAVAQEAPESLLPPGFDDPAPAPTPIPTARPTARPTAAPSAAPAPSGAAPLPPSGPLPTAPNPADLPPVPTLSGEEMGRLPSLEELEALTPDELDERLGLKPKFDIPPAARRSLSQVGLLAPEEGGMAINSLGKQPAELVRAVLAGTQKPLVSRWGHILMRRALASRLTAPEGMNPVEFAALRAGVLNRMGEFTIARALVQDVDTGNWNTELTSQAVTAYIASNDFNGACPAVRLQGSVRDDPQWVMMQAICNAYAGEGALAASQIDRGIENDIAPVIDLLLAQRYAGAAGRGRRAVEIEWDEIEDLNPWRFAMANAVGEPIPQGLLDNALNGPNGVYYAESAASAPMIPLGQREPWAQRAAQSGIFSASAMVDLYSQIYADNAVGGDAAEKAEALRQAYIGGNAQQRISAMQQIWGETRDYAGLVTTAYAAARIAPSEDFAGYSSGLIASMLSAGLDRDAAAWRGMIAEGSLGWALLSVGTDGAGMAPVDAIDTFTDNDDSKGALASAFLVAGLAGLDRIGAAEREAMEGALDIDLRRQTRWTRTIERAAEVENRALVSMLAGLGMQGEDWQQMTPLHLYHIVSALRRVGLEAEARMIAAEAVARA
ncbi:hypothetical protein FGU71_13700 [Erythrobacter insulae]|uniref:Uncharacterized protein n=1 Tax=Erythrobacter insulae TaxID=2584124 RepID=A0A547P7N2_9SPHN|nr:hypothetical protein [Erythrobacter insulae]TRD10044.1 hypothetical protein FGU71_13700 [Erythrobacter insulae]